jgi:hypothetical protein
LERSDVEVRTAITILVAAAALSGCVTPSPEDPAREENWPKVASTVPIAVLAGPAAAGPRSIAVSIVDLQIDLADFTHSLNERIEEALTTQGVTIQPEAQRWVELEVVYANLLRDSPDLFCVIDFTVRTRDGYVFGHQARERGWSVERACDAALSRAALVTLRDSNVRRYLEGP